MIENTYAATADSFRGPFRIRTRKVIGTASLAIGALACATGIATAQPAAGRSAVPEIHYTAQLDGKSVKFSTDVGSLAVRDQHLDVLDDHGNQVAAIPLTYRMNDLDHPIAAAVSDRTVVLTPDTNPAAAMPAADAPRADVHPVAEAVEHVAATYPSPDARSADALATLTQQLTVATMLSGMLATIVGAGVGCVAGLVVGAAATTPVAWLLGAGPIAGCVGGAVLFGSIGAIGGTLLVGGPLAVGAVFQYFQTMNAPIVPGGSPQPGH
ncbi:hypothetical protein J2W56_001008 [Nocardia kruczakiae]|uniref:DUF8020 domain-containing protein n=1 Tax=Nocardia kruczakiae TaxID=261477 RepID=A0ABU1X9S4_9NOCA|nr:hypothetical protein [Nocardia kruczakiae]MDR7167290.1 hypothetical protein [Nocardia kruczakiae]